MQSKIHVPLQNLHHIRLDIFGKRCAFSHSSASCRPPRLLHTRAFFLENRAPFFLLSTVRTTVDRSNRACTRLGRSISVNELTHSPPFRRPSISVDAGATMQLLFRFQEGGLFAKQIPVVSAHTGKVCVYTPPEGLPDCSTSYLVIEELQEPASTGRLELEGKSFNLGRVGNVNRYHVLALPSDRGHLYNARSLGNVSRLLPFVFAEQPCTKQLKMQETSVEDYIQKPEK